MISYNLTKYVVKYSCAQNRTSTP